MLKENYKGINIHSDGKKKWYAIAITNKECNPSPEEITTCCSPYYPSKIALKVALDKDHELDGQFIKWEK